MDRPSPDIDPSGEEVRRALGRLSRRGFATAAAAIAGVVGGWAWLGSRSAVDGLPWPFRRVLRLNERLAAAAFDPARLSREFPAARAIEPRLNGPIGLGAAIDPSAWRLRVVGRGGQAAAREFSLADLLALPRVVSTTELKCVEGWSTVVTWAGARLADVAAATGLATRTGRPDDFYRYASLETPDASYYVGLDIASALHPQTLLAYEMNGAPLTSGHGAPLRLAIPVKYGIKNLKRVGTIQFGDARPRDYWAERGYDWYAGL